MLKYSKCIYILLFIFLLALSSCSTSPEDKIKKHFNSALEYIDNDDIKAAIIELRNVIQVNPKHAKARYELGKLYLKNGDIRAAFEELQRASTLDPQNLDAGIKVAEFYLMAQNRDESRNRLEKILQIDPLYPDGLALLANLEIIDGNYDAAQSALDKVQGDIAQTDRFYNIQGRLYAAQKRYDDSEKMFINALEAGPEKISNYQTLLLFYQRQDLSEKASAIISKINETFPEDVSAQLLKASYYQTIKNDTKAEEALRRLISIKPNKEEYRLMLVSFFRQSGQLNEAEEALNQGLADFPDSLDLKATLADLKFSQKNLNEAESLMHDVLTINKEHRLGLLVKAKISYAQRNTRDAIALLEQITQNYPNWGEPQHFLALCRISIGEIELAQKANEKAIQLSPGNSKYHTLQAQIMLIQGDAAYGGREATIALKLNPRNYPAAILLTRALLQEKRFDDVIKLTSDIRRQVPDDPQLLANLGMAYLGKKHIEEAQKTFLELLAKVPENSKALAMVTSLSAKGDLKAAISFVQKHIAKVPNTAGHYLLLGDLLSKDGRDEEALSAFGEAQQISPEDPQPYIMRARLMHRMGKADEATDEFKALLQTNPNSIPGQLGLAAVYESQKETELAKKIYMKILDLNPTQPVAANNLAYILIQEQDGDLGEALRLGMLAKQALPDDPRIADTLGMIHLRREAYGLAIQQFSLALSEKTNDPVINYHMGLAKWKSNDKEQAITYLEKALSSDAEFDEKAEAEKLLTEWRSDNG